MDIGVEMELIEKRGSYYSYGETRLGQGRENAKQFLRENPEYAIELETRIRQEAGLVQEYSDERPSDGAMVDELDGYSEEELQQEGFLEELAEE